MSRRKLYFLMLVILTFFFLLFILLSSKDADLRERLMNVGQSPQPKWMDRTGSVLTHLLMEPGHPPKANTNSTISGPREATTAYRQLSSQAEIVAHFLARRRKLEEACKQLGHQQLPFPQRTKLMKLSAGGVLPVDVTYCVIPKTGSTTWRRLLSSIRSDVRKIRDASGERRERFRQALPAAAADNDHHHHKDAVSFTFVRDPYSRLLSGYIDKLFSPNYIFSKSLGRYIIQKFRDPNAASSRSLACGFDVTFPEFIRYFIHSQGTGLKRNGHFIPASEQCGMCENSYTYIGHLETIREDMPFILEAMHSTVAENMTFESHTIERNTDMVMRRGKVGIEQCMDWDEALRRLWKKWQVRGVISKQQGFPLSRERTRNISLEDMTRAGLAALAGSGPRWKRVGQKKEALREAFGAVSLQDRLRVKELLHYDFQMFGFDPEPEEVFPSSPYVKDPHFSYFDLYP
ncbi:carbohydrate sulfotransferase 14-like isoform X2 [Babylonia areolata]